MIVGSSLAKGFGTPMPLLAGSASVIRRFEEHSETRIHCSPPSLAALHAAEHALAAIAPMAIACGSGWRGLCGSSVRGYVCSGSELRAEFFPYRY